MLKDYLIHLFKAGQLEQITHMIRAVYNMYNQMNKKQN